MADRPAVAGQREHRAGEGRGSHLQH
jgi:hypothetical protein